MKTIANLMSKFRIIAELFSYLRKRKLWWLIPIVVILLLLIAVLMIESTAGIAPFIYTFL